MKLNIVDRGVPAASPVAPPDPGRDLREDALHELLTAFYATVNADQLLAPYFHHVDMDMHMPRIVAFWSTMVFDTGAYSGSAFQPHQAMKGLSAEHFHHWITTLEQTVDARCAGPRAERMKTMAHRVAYSMQLRMGITPFAPWRNHA